MASKLNLQEINEAIRLIRKDLGEVSKTPFLEGQLKEANRELLKLRASFQEANNDLMGWSKSLKSSLSELTKSNFELSLAKKSFKGLVSIADQFNQIQENGVFLSTKKIAALKLQGVEHVKNLNYAVRYGQLNKADAAEIQNRINKMGEFNDSLEDAEKFQKRVQGQTGVGFFGALSELSGAIPGMSTLTGMFDKASEAATETAFQNEKQVDSANDLNKLAGDQRKRDLESLKTGKGLNEDAVKRLGLEDQGLKFKKDGDVNMSSLNPKKMAGLEKSIKGVSKIPVPKGISAMMAGVKSLGPALTKALGPVGILLELLKGFLAADAQATKLQKTMMLTQGEARQFNIGLQRAAANQNNIAVTGTKVFETFMSINKELGFIAKFSSDTLGSATKLQQVLGVSAGSSANLAAASEATGTSLESNYEDILGSSYQLQMQYKTQLDMKSVLEETGQVTGLIRANLGGNVVSIAKAVTQAKLLGTNMKTVAAAGKQLLNFEQSISNEMNAELLTGRQLNLERARAAALMGNQEELAKELAANMGDFTSFTKLNVIQAEALAAAMGMTADQVADQLFTMETMGKTAEELRAIGKDELADRLEAKSAQDQMNAAMEQLKQTFVGLGTALLPIVNIIGLVAGILQGLIGLLQDAIGFFTGAQQFGDISNAAKGGKTIANSFQALGGAGYDAKSVEDGIISPDGEIISTSPADYLIATKNPGALASSVGGNNGETNNLLKRLISVVEAGGDVILDGNKVGRNLTMASSGIG